VNLREKLIVWYTKLLIKKRLRVQAENLRAFSRLAPVPAEVFGSQNILAHYKDCTTMGTGYALVVVNGIPQQSEYEMVTETAKVRFPDESVALIKVVYIRDHAPWQKQ
jgi:hypothetical protein